jgi:hypothetical protein
MMTINVAPINAYELPVNFAARFENLSKKP